MSQLDLSDYAELDLDMIDGLLHSHMPWEDIDAEAMSVVPCGRCQLCGTPIWSQATTCVACRPEWDEKQAEWKQRAKAQTQRLCEMARKAR
jgi:hypothetical protein